MARTMWRALPAMIGGAGLVLAVGAPALGQEDPAGNNGTVKIDGVVFDDHPDNQPHVGCTFQVDFYGFDAGDLQAEVTFEAIPPTVPDEMLALAAGTPLLSDTVDIGGDAAGGGTDLDASETYDLTEELAAITPHPVQGWHVRLTVHAEGSQGADTKFKVFWVSGCEDTTTTTGESTTSTTGGTTTTTSKDTTSTTEHGSTTSGPSTSSGPSSSVSPSTGEMSSTTIADEGGNLPTTGSNVLPMVLVGTVLVGLGAGGVMVARRLRLQGQ